MYVTMQTLEYREHGDELSVIAKALEALRDYDSHKAIEILVARHHALIADQTPVVKSYDQKIVGHW